MRLLITGGAGFIGSHLCEHFLAEGHNVVAMDNLLTGRMSNIQHLARNQRFSFVKQDVTNIIELPGKLDAVLHFASPASPLDYAHHPIATMKVGALGSHKALGVAKSKGAKFLLASTSEIYGDPEVNPQPETYWGYVNPIGPRSVYDEAKRFAEAMTMAYHRTHGVPVRIVRIFNTYGERMRTEDGRAVPNFITQALRGEPLTVYGDGSQTRSLCYVKDLVEGIARLLESSVTTPVNIGNPHELTIRQIAELVLRLTGSKSPIVHCPLPIDDPRQRCPDIRLAQRELQWVPRVSIEEGLTRTIEHFKLVIKEGGGATAQKGPVTTTL